MKFVLRSFIVGALIAAFGAAQAWNAVGHMAIAMLAQQNLKPNVRATADRLLAAAPAGTPTDFVAVSTWADEIRNDRRETGPWHYEDHHFRADGRPVTTHADAENAVWAIDKFSKIVADKTKSDAERGEALRFLIHFVGDIHQPLHATARDTDAEPGGDKGGNDFRIEPPTSLGDRPPRNLHSLWDLGGGFFHVKDSPRSAEGQQEIRAIATEMAAKYPRRSLSKVGDQTPEDWAMESFADAKAVVYALPEHTVPSEDYLAKARDLSERRAATAGYRLADLLNRLLK